MKRIVKRMRDNVNILINYSIKIGVCEAHEAKF